MENHLLIEALKQVKQDKGYTLYDLSRILDVQVSTVSRWFKTSRINRVYAQLVKDKMKML